MRSIPLGFSVLAALTVAGSLAHAAAAGDHNATGRADAARFRAALTTARMPERLRQRALCLADRCVAKSHTPGTSLRVHAAGTGDESTQLTLSHGADYAAVWHSDGPAITGTGKPRFLMPRAGHYTGIETQVGGRYRSVESFLQPGGDFLLAIDEVGDGSAITWLHSDPTGDHVTELSSEEISYHREHEVPQIVTLRNPVMMPKLTPFTRTFLTPPATPHVDDLPGE